MFVERARTFFAGLWRNVCMKSFAAAFYFALAFVSSAAMARIIVRTALLNGSVYRASITAHELNPIFTCMRLSNVGKRLERSSSREL